MGVRTTLDVTFEQSVADVIGLIEDFVEGVFSTSDTSTLGLKVAPLPHLGSIVEVT